MATALPTRQAELPNRSDLMITDPIYPDLAPPYDVALRDITSWIIQTLSPQAVIACGSIVRGQGDHDSDLDMQVIHDLPWRQRRQRRVQGLPCEILISPVTRLRGYFR